MYYKGLSSLCIYFQSINIINNINGIMILNINWNLWYHIKYKYGIIFCRNFSFSFASVLFTYYPKYLYANEPLNYIASFNVLQFIYVINIINNIRIIVISVYYINWWMYRWEKNKNINNPTKYIFNIRIVFADFFLRIFYFYCLYFFYCAFVICAVY